MLPTLLESSPTLSLVYALTLYACLLAMARVSLRWWPAVSAALTPGTTRHGALDGLRGALAAGVLIHHSYAIYGYRTTGEWGWSASPILNQLGQSTVAMFFMITGFLFTLKASQARLDWLALYRSRLARLLPLYVAVVVAVFGCVLALSGGRLNVPPGQLLMQFLQWLAFVCFGRPDINGLPMSWTLIAGVNWSLKYEVGFYVMAVPVLHLAARAGSLRICLAAAAVLLGGVLAYRGMRTLPPGLSLYVAHFLCGIVTAYAYRLPSTRAWLSSRTCRCLAVLALGALCTMPQYTGAAAVLCALVVFAAVVGGASGFGVLYSRPAIWLGDISYGIYLMHGLLLWLVVCQLVPLPLLMQLGLPGYLMLVLAVTVAVFLLASLSYVQLERPMMRWAATRRPMVAAQLKSPG